MLRTRLLRKVAQHLVELLLGYLSARVPLTNDADWFVSPKPFTPILPSRPPVEASDDKQYEEYDHKNDEEFPRKVSYSEGEEVKKQHEHDDEPDRQHKQCTDHAAPGRTAIGLTRH